MKILHGLSVVILFLIWGVAFAAISLVVAVCFIPLGVIGLTLLLADAIGDFVRELFAPLPVGLVRDRRWDIP